MLVIMKSKISTLILTEYCSDYKLFIRAGHFHLIFFLETSPPPIQKTSLLYMRYVSAWGVANNPIKSHRMKFSSALHFSHSKSR